MAYVKTWDFTFFGIEELPYDPLPVWDWLSKNCSKFAFQVEKCKETGRLHLQGRLRLRNRVRIGGLVVLVEQSPINGAHFSPTSSDQADRQTFSYAIKDDTRVEGPWTDANRPTPPPRCVREMEKQGLFPWQETMLKICDVQKGDNPDMRSINVLINKEGKIGKTWVSIYAHFKGIAKYIQEDTAKSILGAAIDNPCHAYIIDLPRSLDRKKLKEIYYGIEKLKNGVLSDPRYRHRQIFIEMPCIWVMTNEMPDLGLLSDDRWKFWEVREDELELVED